MAAKALDSATLEFAVMILLTMLKESVKNEAKKKKLRAVMLRVFKAIKALYADDEAFV